MAWSLVNNTFLANRTTAGTSLTSAAVGNTVEVGNAHLILIALDNSGTGDGDNSEVTSVTDSASNTYTKLGEFTNGNGSAGAGATVSLWYSILTSQLTSGAGTVTANFSSRNAVAMMGWEATLTNPGIITIAGSLQTLANDAADPGSMAISGLSSREYLFLRVIASESNDTTSMTVTGGFTTMNLSRANTGTSSTSMIVRGEYKIATATSATSDPTLYSADHASLFIALKEDSSAQTVSPAALALAATFPAPTVDQTLLPAALALAPTFPSASLQVTFQPAALALAPAFPSAILDRTAPLSALALAATFPSATLDQTTSAAALALAATFPATSMALGITGSALALAVTFPAGVVVAAPPPPTSLWDIVFVLFDAAHGERWPVFPLDASIGHDKTMVGSGSLTFPGGDDAPTLFMGAIPGAEFPEVTVRVYCRGTRIYTGVGVAVRLNSGGPNGVCEITFEHAYGHFLRRRQIFQSSLTAVDLTDEADDAILLTQKAQIGAAPTIPAGHPGTRTDFGSFTVTVRTGSSLAPSIKLLEQSGQSLLDVTQETIEANDLAPIMVDSETGTFALSMTYPFEDDDLSDLVIFSQYHGNLATFEYSADRTSIVNVWGVEGKTANSAAWDSDSASITLWGEFEGFAQKPQDTNDVTAKNYVAGALTDRHAPAKLTYKATIIETIGHQFVTDFFWRDNVRIYDAVWDLNITGAITAWSMRVSNGRMHELDLVMGEPRERDIVRELVSSAGIAGGRMLGKWRNRRQS